MSENPKDPLVALQNLKEAAEKLTTPEIADLETAIEKVISKIKWHEEKINNLGEEISMHKSEIDALKSSLRKIVGPVLGQSVVPTEDYNTGYLIMECLKKSKTPVNTRTIKSFLEDRGNDTQPGTELSRMIKKGIIFRSGRGLYSLKK
jgi:hypothetical protein